MMQRSNVILIALKVQNSFKQSFGAKVQRRSVQSRSDLQSKRRVERLYWRLLPGSDKVVVSYCWAELGLQMVMVKIRNDGGCMIVVQFCNCCTIVVQLCDQWPRIKLLVAATSAATHFQIRHNLLQRDSYFFRCANFFSYKREYKQIRDSLFPCAYKIVLNTSTNRTSSFLDLSLLFKICYSCQISLLSTQIGRFGFDKLWRQH